MLAFGKTALLLGDFKENLGAIVNSLKVSGVHTWQTNELAEAIRHQRTAPASVVVCDLPSFSDSLLALKELREAEPSTSVILLAPTSGWRWVDLLENGAFDVMGIPYQVSDLAWMVNNALRSHTTSHYAKA